MGDRPISTQEFRSLNEALDHVEPLTEADIREASRTQRVEAEKDKLSVRRQAEKALREEEAKDGFNPPAVQSLVDWEKAPPEPARFRIDQLSIVGGNTTIAAQYKAGKTTLGINRVRSLVDGEPFLDHFDVLTPIRGNVVYLNYEVSDSQFYDWLTRHRIRNKKKVIPINLRGRGIFIQDDVSAEWLVKVLKDHDAEVLELDPLSAAIRGNTSSEEVASEFLTRLDNIKLEAGVTDLFMTTHTGHLTNKDSDGRASNERTSGSARFMGWPDAFWTYTFDADKVRYLSARGRDVEVDEFSLQWDEPTIRLSVESLKTNRANRRVEKLQSGIFEYLKSNPKASKTDVSIGVRGSKSAVLKMVDELIHDGLIEETTVAHNKKELSISGGWDWALESAS